MAARARGMERVPADRRVVRVRRDRRAGAAAVGEAAHEGDGRVTVAHVAGAVLWVGAAWAWAWLGWALTQ